eukprot:1375087-Prymnesium_polylepis.1
MPARGCFGAPLANATFCEVNGFTCNACRKTCSLCAAKATTTCRDSSNVECKDFLYPWASGAAGLPPVKTYGRCDAYLPAEAEAGTWVASSARGLQYRSARVRRGARRNGVDFAEDVNAARRCLARNPVLFVGDSNLRYQYAALAHYLHRGVWDGWPRAGRPDGRSLCNGERAMCMCVCTRASDPQGAQSDRGMLGPSHSATQKPRRPCYYTPHPCLPTLPRSACLRRPHPNPRVAWPCACARRCIELSMLGTTSYANESTRERTARAWRNYYSASATILEGQESCECDRRGSGGPKSIENRVLYTRAVSRTMASNESTPGARAGADGTSSWLTGYNWLVSMDKHVSTGREWGSP